MPFFFACELGWISFSRGVGAVSVSDFVCCITDAGAAFASSFSRAFSIASAAFASRFVSAALAAASDALRASSTFTAAPPSQGAWLYVLPHR
ncbi:hypothetical protein [Ramlibacter albus]|uniref:Uncharacterized protein n=1 Tax=Ramlibacter albus TaxID=2079448 RepID=A0A923M5G2_9BURK|nr:hypothetical protein [Ramlibacter albus]MBC5763106.1 hypothetical protein [Ramlibacter albus]